MIDIMSYVIESNAIEGIWRAPTEEELNATEKFLALGSVTALDLENLAKAYQPDAKLRYEEGMNVTVGGHLPPSGGHKVTALLEGLLYMVNQGTLAPHESHCRYEYIHPLTDGNGRTGRALWLWHMKRDGLRVHLPFLQHWYYQTLEEFREGN